VTRWLLLAVAAAAPAMAADQPVIAPAPAWVHPEPIGEDKAKSDDQPIRFLLLDQQSRLEAGKESNYGAYAVKIQTPQGLAAGNISLPWRPETDTLTVHRIVIHRGAEAIDVLKSQTFTVARRETNMEIATLDGVLTANIQPEGLQVGDVLEVAATVTSSDPVMKGHVEQSGAAWNIPAQRAHMHLEWPASIPLRVRSVGALPPAVTKSAGGFKSYDIAINDVQPVIPPKGAPARFAVTRLIEATDFASWADMATLMAPLYRDAAVVPADGPLATELATIKGASADPKTRATAALALVQNRVRYVALLMGAGGLTPAKASETWSRRYGDCKAKTALLLALLHNLDIDAVPVVVSTRLGDGMDQRLPMIGLFDHVIVRATIAGKDYWLDGTRTGDTSLDRLEVPNFRWGLPIVPNAQLAVIMPKPLDKPSDERIIKIDARGGLSLPAPIHVETILRGDDAASTKLAFDQMTADVRDKAMREYWKKEFDSVEIKSSTIVYDPATGEQKFILDGLFPMHWKDGWYETDNTGIGWKADFVRDKGDHADAPFAVDYPSYSRTLETILLPPGFPDKPALQPAVDEVIAGVAYKRTAKIAGNVATIERTARSLAPEFPFSESVAAQTRLRALNDQDVYLRAPDTYQPTKAEADAALAKQPTTAKEYLARARLLGQQKRIPEAVAAVDAALKLDPNDTEAQIMHAAVLRSQKNLPEARRELDAVLQREPDSAFALQQRALAEMQNENFAGAIPYLDRAVAQDSKNTEILAARAEARARSGNAQGALSDLAAARSGGLELPYFTELEATAFQQLGRSDEALAAAAKVLATQPNNAGMRLLRANIYRRSGKLDLARGEADALLVAKLDDPFGYVAAGKIYDAIGPQENALKAFDRALALKPEAYIYVNRAEVRPKADTAGRYADYRAAIALDPGSEAALLGQAQMQIEAKDWAGMIATYDKLVALKPGNPYWLMNRGIGFLRMGNETKAAADFAATNLATTSDAQLLNAVCYERAKIGKTLDTALAECNRAVALQPASSAIIDSRGLVNLRLGHFDDSIADFSKAIAASPQQAESLYGRGLAYAKKGDKAHADADFAAALKADSKVAERYDEMGLTR
jgi:tetratricopeptide (TPR) repeat protein